MKKLLLFLFFSISALCAFSQAYIGADGALHPTGPFALAHTNEIKGAPKTVADIAARDAIATNLREPGMLAYIQATKEFYYLDGGIDNANWKLFTGSGSGGSNFTGIVQSIEATRQYYPYIGYTQNTNKKVGMSFIDNLNGTISIQLVFLDANNNPVQPVNNTPANAILSTEGAPLYTTEGNPIIFN